ncbi:hypothetical protein D9M71_497600 [compost metagenome]
MAGALRQRRGGAVRLVEGEADRQRPGLVVILPGQPAPGIGGAGVDTGDQGRRAVEQLQGGLGALLLGGAVLVGEDELHHPGAVVVGQGEQLRVVQLLLLRHGEQHPGVRLLAGDCQGDGAAVGQRTVLQPGLGGRTAPDQQREGDDDGYEYDEKMTPATFQHVSVSPVRSGRRRSGRRYRPAPPADRVRLARPGSGVPSRAGTCP